METIVAVAVGAAILVLLLALLYIALGPRSSQVGAAEAVGGVPVPVDEATASGMPQKILISVGIFIFAIVFMGGYWLTEPMRNAQALQQQEEAAVERGTHNFAKYCARCHGDRGQGLVGPSLHIDAIQQRHKWNLEDADQKKAAHEFLYNTVYYGWPPIYRGQPPIMPNWGENAGGPLNYEQVSELVAFVLSPNDKKWDEVHDQLAAAGQLPKAPEGAQAGANATPAEKGQAVFLSRGCTGCHTIDSLKDKGATGQVGPNLTHVASLDKIVNVLPMSEENLKKWLKDPPAVKPGTTMPNLGLSDEEINDLAAFLMTQK